MKVITTVFLVIASVVLGQELSKDVCPPGPLNLLYIRPQCCGLDFLDLGLLGIDCQDPPMPVNGTNFKAVCKQRKPACCSVSVLELLGLRLICRKPNAE
ncbi:cerato-ulmin-like [Bradysia coprophila]|uniref:cerato-ulmin-like n=1 Tax=Bradysia coprophila TaxID=38358 RepID=UPI00187D7FC0|nr:cerato-ulmin-like [Bradysia coprophila]